MNHFPSFVAPLNDLAVIEITGQDAASFLHGQLTHDVSGLTPGVARYAGYCTAKGRLLGNMVVWQGQQTETPVLYAMTKADIAATLVKRLSMFVLRAKAKLQLAPVRVWGVALAAAGPGQANSPAQSPDTKLLQAAAGLAMPPQPWSLTHTQAGTWIAAPCESTNITRWWLLATEAGDPASASLAENASANEFSQLWQAADIAAGLPWVVAATQDLFIPQTLNLDLIDGVSFSKGCYPGQEVVARSHYRGTVKRRMAYGVIEAVGGLDAGALPGLDTYNANKPDNPCGRIINAAHARAGIHVLMEVQLADLDNADFRLGQADGAAIKLMSLPYQIQA
ncbi:folate-binding protein YgfZ [Alcaligenaceae bacterium]|nr:folate-binding protein YgfZ [Alcaligenaceae bacterium]